MVGGIGTAVRYLCQHVTIEHCHRFIRTNGTTAQVHRSRCLHALFALNQQRLTFIQTNRKRLIGSMITCSNNRRRNRHTRRILRRYNNKLRRYTILRIRLHKIFFAQHLRR